MKYLKILIFSFLLILTSCSDNITSPEIPTYKVVYNKQLSEGIDSFYLNYGKKYLFTISGKSFDKDFLYNLNDKSPLLFEKRPIDINLDNSNRVSLEEINLFILAHNKYNENHTYKSEVISGLDNLMYIAVKEGNFSVKIEEITE